MFFLNFKKFVVVLCPTNYEVSLEPTFSTSFLFSCYVNLNFDKFWGQVENLTDCKLIAWSVSGPCQLKTEASPLLGMLDVGHSEHNLNATLRLKYPGHQSEKIDSGF